jgi:ATP-dependent Clp protease ATP-binding subunit ClpA
MFLAGPTGTGKTEIVKTVAELLFGDEKALIRFDMSEYAAEHSDQKLFGAPPGYVGYDRGGQLTNAVKNNPFSVLLFDEIEKAHTSVMDKFLQILEDGRMTDGQGNTVYFSETLIFFTSNAGIYEETCDTLGRVIKREAIVKPGESYEELRRAVETALKTKFKPEILNRIGKNIVVFDYITEDATKKILRLQLEKIALRIFTKSKIAISVEESAMGRLLEKCLEEETRENGGRGIGNIVESSFLNPLSEFIFDSDIKASERINALCAEDKLVFERTV